MGSHMEGLLEEARERHHVSPTLGFVVNPVAGLGGAVALKGSDGENVQRRARAAGAVPRAAERAELALVDLLARVDDVDIVTASGPMGADVVRAADVLPSRVRIIHDVRVPTSSEDTTEAVRAIADLGVDLLLFVGGDGTARDVARGADDRVCVLGVPAGVKMQSSVFAVSPNAAARVAADFLSSPRRLTEVRDVVDIDEEEVRCGVITSTLYGHLRTPRERRWLQGRKVGASAGSSELHELAGSLASSLVSGRRYALGPGTTTEAVARSLGLTTTLLGVDVITTDGVLGADVTADQLAALIEDDTEIILSPTGRQGFLLGRGNQQISTAVLSRLAPDHLVIVATHEKLAALEGRPLLVDTGDPMLDDALCGFRRVIVGPNEWVPYCVGTREEEKS